MKYKLYINGRWLATNEYFPTINPATEEILAEIPSAGKKEAEEAICAAREALMEWASDSKMRRKVLQKFAQEIYERKDSIAEWETLDNGMPLHDGEFGVMATVEHFDYFAGWADKLHGLEIPTDPVYRNYTVRVPRGVTAHIIPWNVPLIITARSVAPALASGNTVIIKPSSATSVTALLLAEAAEAAGIPDGVFNVITGSGGTVGRWLSSSPKVDSVTFTGSTENGRNVMRDAASGIKKTMLELGGKSPNLVYADAPFEEAIEGALKGIFLNSGQECFAGSRLIVEDIIADDFISELVSATRRLRIGPGIENADITPLINAEQQSTVLDYVRIGKEEGAALATGGKVPEGFENGYYVEPTIFDHVDNSMRIAQEEIFGPVLVVIRASRKNMVEIANDTPYGLAAGLWTMDLGRAHTVAEALDAGAVFVNDYPIMSYALPFGGFKESGVGTEKGLDGILEYTKVKTISVRIHPKTSFEFYRK